ELPERFGNRHPAAGVVVRHDLGDRGTRRLAMGTQMKRAVDDLARAFIATAAVVAILFLLLPVAMSVVMSFDSRGYLGPFPPPGFSLRWYEKFFSSASIVGGLKTSLAIGLVSTGAATLVGLLTALGIARTRRFRPFLLSLFLSPLMIPAAVVGFS